MNVALSSHGSSCEEDGGPKTSNPCDNAFDGILLGTNSWIAANPGIGAWIKVSKLLCTNVVIRRDGFCQYCLR